jgi:hypothetical protein
MLLLAILYQHILMRNAITAFHSTLQCARGVAELAHRDERPLVGSEATQVWKT